MDFWGTGSTGFHDFNDFDEMHWARLTNTDDSFLRPPMDGYVDDTSPYAMTATVSDVGTDTSSPYFIPLDQMALLSIGDSDTRHYRCVIRICTHYSCSRPTECTYYD